MGTPVSGPGQFSQRTDRAVSAASESLPNAEYGENRDYQEQKSGAPMAQGQDVTGMDFSSLFGNPGDRVTGLGEDSAMPDVPVTDGAAMGAGAGPEVLSSSAQTSDKAYFAAYLPVLEYIANQPGSSDAARNLVRRVKYES